MRGRIAAACAAVLVGLAPAVPLSSFAVAAACASVESTSTCAAGSTPIQGELPAGAVSRSKRSFSRPASERTIWRDPSAPAPSQAPPAARE